MTAVGEDTRRVVAAGRTRQAAADLFGASFDHLLLATYDDLGEAVAGGHTDLVALAAGPDGARALRAVLAVLGESPQLAARVQIVVEVPGDAEELGAVREVLTGPAAPALSGVVRHQDRPCVVLGGPPVAPDRAAVVSAVLDAAETRVDCPGHHRAASSPTWAEAALQARAEQAEAEVEALRAELRRSAGSGSTDRQTSRSGTTAQAVPLGGVVASTVTVLRRRVGTGWRAVAVVAGLGAALTAPALLLGLATAVSAVLAAVVLGVLLGAVALGLAVIAAVVLLHHRAAAHADVGPEECVGADPADGGDSRSAAVLSAVDAVRGDVEATRAELEAALVREAGALRRVLEASATLEALAPLRSPVLAHDDEPPPDLVLAFVDELARSEPPLVVGLGVRGATLRIASAVRERGLRSRIVVLEHDARTAGDVRTALRREGLDQHAEVRWAPLTRSGVAGHVVPWYDEAAVADLDGIDLLLVHGPPARVGPAAALPAVPVLRDRLRAEFATVVLGGGDRSEVSAVADRWAELLRVVERRDVAAGGGAVVLRVRD